ncbi:MAG TPA: hypothetical protein PLP27_09835 [Crocinitomicaceae bacterium]|nr:hypothetical protein [Crocinitomicaceae bacterium]
MKRLAILFTFFLVSFNGFCDTINYWHVYINDELVAKFDENSKDLTLKIKKSDLKESDLITVRYFSDTPCIDCLHKLNVFAEIKQQLPHAETKEHFGKLSIPIKDLLAIKKRYEITKFPFTYYVRYESTDDVPLETKERLVLILQLI